MLSKAHLTSHSRMSGSRSVITPSWLSGSWRSFLYSSSVYSCRLSWAIPNPERWCCESAALNMPANLENSAVATGLKKVSFYSNPKERQCQKCSNYRTIALISHASKVTLKILQARLQQYVNHELNWTENQLTKTPETQFLALSYIFILLWWMCVPSKFKCWNSNAQCEVFGRWEGHEMESSLIGYSSVQFSCSVTSDSLQPHGL